MNVHDLVEARVYLENETKNNYQVLYEKFQHSTCHFEEDGRFSVKEGENKEVVHIFRGKNEDTLYAVETYDLHQFSSIDALLEQVKLEHKEIFV
ncbi:hypothetical protein SAMN05192534_1421 [Alteribacillus persepolensis]|uniref:Uncharacterized protein n=1 Tax=Alteribacillus persepolensis TaxID=568899 RepID=A0A1G8K5J5_9BACI|nr:hypothetical protein [Alteribacillus persepolensis]SDI38756.1 hypothetical protein SAMN05192534_1421 [Alteribacillus persepolensis]